MILLIGPRKVGYYPNGVYSCDIIHHIVQVKVFQWYAVLIILVVCYNVRVCGIYTGQKPVAEKVLSYNRANRVVSPRVRLFRNVRNFNVSSLSLCFNFITNLVALIWTFSKRDIREIVRQITIALSFLIRLDPVPLSQGDESPPSWGSIYEPGNQSCPSNIM